MSALVLRCCGPQGESYGSFRWPLAVGAEVVAPDWSARAACGNGLHGWLYGAGDINAANIVDDGAWLVVEVDSSSLVMLGGKCKFPRGTVRFVGSMREAAAYLIEHEPRAKTCAVIGATLSGGRREVVQVGALGTATAGYRGTATAGDRGTATAGDRGTATAGDRGTATAGDSGTATAGDLGTATAGDSGTATAGYRGTATAGDRGTATAGDRGTATAGDSGTATAGDRGTATAGDSGTATAGDLGTATAGYSGTATAGYRGTATAGDSGTATAGYRGAIVIEWYDSDAGRYRRTLGCVGEDGIEANVPYRCNTGGKLVRAQEAA
jgi:hypothetical protein